MNQNDKVIVSPKAVIVRRELMFSGKGINAVVITPVTSEGLEELLAYREQQRKENDQKAAQQVLVEIVKKKTIKPWEQHKANQILQSLLN